MHILWHRVVALLFVTVAVVIFIVNRRAVVGFVRSIEQVGPGHTPDEVTTGLASLGLIVIALLAALRIVLNDQNRSNP